ncbi:HAD hydrolase-like protein [Anaeromicropila herbilytica]|uniref:HAD hydrolase-like protein n=1 Tax=Anaeromicropila herbilytica TaxID=2785025 RepID=UPI00232A1A17|nr:HAD hydrolase-like protein [Anaeromicropila herbilytica]
MDSLKKQINSIGSIEIVSFDIFDTVLFRTVKKPSDAFLIIADHARKLRILNEYISDEAFKNIRIEAEKSARYNKKILNMDTEVTLKEIYNCMPKIISSIDRMVEIEIEVEKHVCYLNSLMAELISYLHSVNKKIIFTSDMYLNKQQITEILVENNFDIQLIDDIIVSCDYLKSKRSGELYNIVLDKYKADANQVIHIGDNYTSDIISAHSYGIHTIYYDVISCDDTLEMQMEELKYGDLVPEIYSLRKYLLSMDLKYSEEERKWFDIGACVMGPLLSAATEWVLDTADENNILNIYPLMREGKILSKLLDQAQKARNTKYNIKPTYVSRKALLLPSIQHIDKERIKEILNIRYIKIKDVFQLLNIEELMNEFIEYSDLEVRESRGIDMNSSTIGNALEEYLLSDKVSSSINSKVKDHADLAFNYLKDVGLHKECITIDLGFKGTIQCGIEQLLGKYNISSNNINMLIFASKNSVETVMKNIDLRGYAGTCGENDDLISLIKLYPFILEQLMMCDEGTTVGYVKEDNKVKPITKEIDSIAEKQFLFVDLCQQGILAYQKIYLEVLSKKKYLKSLNKRELTKIICRMLNSPTLAEALLLSKLNHEENYGAESFKQICRDEHLKLIKDKGIEYFCSSVSPRDVLWLEGLIVQADPLYYFNKIVENSESNYEKSILKIIKKISDANVSEIVIIGAGEVGRKVCKYLQLYGIKVEAFIDNNKKLHGHCIENIQVKSMNTKFKSNNFIIASFAFITELKKQANDTLGKNIALYYQGM